MSEVTFAKAFMASLDKRPIKLAADYVSDPRKYPSQSPPHQFPRPTESTTTQRAPSQTIKVTLKPMRNGDAVTLSDVALDATIHEIKTQYAAKSDQAVEKIKLLLNKKPVADLKTLKELGVESDVEISVMILGGAAAASPAAAGSPGSVQASERMDVDSASSAPGSERAQLEAPHTATAGALSQATDILKTEEFWSDLRAFLSQRLRNEEEGKSLTGVFRSAWGAR